MRKQQISPKQQKLMEQARTRPIVPRKEPPPWLDWEQLQTAQAFQKKYRAYIMQVHGTSSLAATFAAQDIAPVLMQTGRLPNDFVKRMEETQTMMESIQTSFASRETFLKNNYVNAVELGNLHRQVADSVRGPLKWNPKERIPMSQQAFAFVLYTFAWWPIEAMLAQKTTDTSKSNKEFDAWFHYWSVLGYGMGVMQELLPLSYAIAKERVEWLRQAQYVPIGKPRPEGIATLLGGQVLLIAQVMSKKNSDDISDTSSRDKLIPFSAGMLSSMIAQSLGLREALGLEKEAVNQLIGFTKSPPKQLGKV
jgi:ER-bound oxygenase mpaB/B'/Rubber oxygenase, catalytic domain